MRNPFRSIRSVAFNLFAISVLPIAVLGIPTSQTLTGGSVAAEFRGEWVPAKSQCSSPLRLIIESTAVVFVKGSDRAEYRAG